MEKIELIKKDIEKQNYEKAERSLRELILKDKNNYHYQLLLGFTFEKNNKINEAIKTYIFAKKLKPTDVIHNLLGNIYTKTKKYSEALYEFACSIKINKNNPKTLNNYGLLLIVKRRESESIKYFEDAISLDPNYMDPKYNLLEILEKSNEFVLFKKLIVKEIKFFPNDEVLKYFYAAYLNLIKKNIEAINILKNIKFINHKQNWEYRRLNLLGKIYDEIKNYKKAFEAHNSANKFLINNFCLRLFSEKKYYNKIKKLSLIAKKNINPFNLTKNKNSSLFFLVGFPRSGTTLLDAILSSHSKIEVIEEKPSIENILKKVNSDEKILCQSLDVKYLNIKYYSEIEKHISSKKINKKIIIDKMPLNLIYSRAINNIFPEAKIIFCLRHPLDVILSCYFQNFILNEAMVNFLDLKRTASLYNYTMEIFNSYSEISEKNIIKVRYENLVSNFDTELNELLNFIGVPYEPEMKNFFKKKQDKKRVRTASYNQVNKPIYKSSRFKWINYREDIEQINKSVEKWIKFYEY